jgi:hypothetical protein
MTENYGYPAAPPPPQGWQQPAPQRGAPPSTVMNAFRLMLVTAALSVIGIIATFATKDDLRQRLRRANLDADTTRLDNLVNTAIAISLVVAIVFVVLYVLLAFKVRAGRNWARIVTWVLAGLGVLSLLGALSTTATPLSRTLSVISGLIDIVIIVLLAQRPSNDYFRGSARQR